MHIKRDACKQCLSIVARHMTTPTRHPSAHWNRVSITDTETAAATETARDTDTATDTEIQRYRYRDTDVTIDSIVSICHQSSVIGHRSSLFGHRFAGRC